MPRKKKVEEEEEDDDEGEWIEEDLDEIDDPMLEDDDGLPPREEDEILQMLREVECADCKGSSTKDRCKVRKEHGCPPDKADK